MNLKNFYHGGHGEHGGKDKKSYQNSVKLRVLRGYIFLIVFVVCGCNNHFHDLIPPDGDRIISFEVPTQEGEAVIGESEITAKVNKRTNLRSLLPGVRVSPGANVIPLTADYLQAAFPSADIFSEMQGLYQSSDIPGYVRNLIKRNPDFNFPPLNRPVDFFNPVRFLVVSAQGGMREYTVDVSRKSDGPEILDIRFSKYDNPEMVDDALCMIDGESRTISAMVRYPVETPGLSYTLVPSFEIIGDSLISDGNPVESGKDPIRFETIPGILQIKTLTVMQGDASEDYSLSVIFAEDPDTTQSIIDFRFVTEDNPSIAVDAAASIFNNGDTGTITVQVFHSGVRPSVLVPRFISPGTVTVSGQVQTSGSSSHDFSVPVEYRVVSSNGLYDRTYTVKTEFISLTEDAPRMLSFAFSAGLNEELVQNSAADINDTIGLIVIRAYYSGNFLPDMLIPEFTAQGLVTVGGSVQISGSSSQDFSYQVKYTVTNPENSLLTRDYWVQCQFVRLDPEEPRLLEMRFSKYDNPEQVNDAACAINEGGKIITLKITYPAEIYNLSYALIPSFEINGDSLSVDGTQILSRKGKIQFNAVLGTQIKTVSVSKGGLTVNYTLTVFFAEDPDTVRSITDFRFVKSENASNALIASDAVASIINSDRTGTINVQVLYSGAKPSVLYPRFISPGTVTVAGQVQTSGITSHNFSTPFEYRVVSRNALYVRVYTVKVEFINLSTDAPKILSFTLPRGLNRGLVQDAVGEINDTSERISIEARYSGHFVPDLLVPEFTAQGLVSVSGSVQISGFSSQDFSRLLRFTVTNPENPLLKRDYTVQCQFVRDDSSDAVITAFGFYPEDNLGLADILTARIDQGDGKITLYAPAGSGVTGRVMIPQFSASGQVSVSDTLQRSGFTGRLFDGPVVYTVVSANGQNRRDYTVDVKELGSTMFVNHRAMGLNDGTSWQNAFVSLKAACEAASLFPRDVPKEIWIAAGTYTPETTDDYFTVAPNTSHIGGFAGGETAKTQRNIAANPVIISGSPTKKQPNNIHAAFFNREVLLNGENTAFEDMEFRNFMLNERTGSGFIYNPISLRWVSNAQGAVTVRGCKFTDVNGLCIETSNGSTHLYNVNAERIAALYNNNKADSGLYLETDDVVDNVRIVSQIRYGNAGYAPLFLFFGGERPASTLTLSGLNLQNCVTGVFINGNAAIINMTNLTVRNINTVDEIGGDKGSVLEIEGGGRVSITGADIDGVVNGRSFFGTIFLHEIRGTISMTNVTVKNVSVPTGDEYGGGGGISINNWGDDYYYLFGGSSGYIVNRGGRIEMRNVRLQNIKTHYLPALNIFKPEADIYLNDITVEYDPARTSGEPVYILDHNNLFADNLNFKSSAATHTPYFRTRNTTPGEVNMNRITTTAGNIQIIGYYKDISVTNATIDGNLSVSGTGANITVDTVSVWQYSSSGYKNLSLSNANLSRNLYIYAYNSNPPTENTELNNVKMQNSNSAQDIRPYISIGRGTFSAKDSTFLLRRVETNTYNDDSSYQLDFNGTIYDGSGTPVYGVFDNCTFETYGPYKYNNTHYYLFDIGHNANIEIKNSRFNFNSQSNGPGAIRAVGGGRFYLDGVSFNNYNSATGYILYLYQSSSYRIKQSNSSYNGSSFTNAATRTAFNNLVIKSSDAVITWE